MGNRNGMGKWKLFYRSHSHKVAMDHFWFSTRAGLWQPRVPAESSQTVIEKNRESFVVSEDFLLTPKGVRTEKNSSSIYST